MPSDWEIVRTMERYGGSFARALARCCDCADPEHLARIKAAFPDLWKKYAEMHQMWVARERERTNA